MTAFGFIILDFLPFSVMFTECTVIYNYLAANPDGAVLCTLRTVVGKQVK